jgi:hypothetical protein
MNEWMKTLFNESYTCQFALINLWLSKIIYWIARWILNCSHYRFSKDILYRSRFIREGNQRFWRKHLMFGRIISHVYTIKVSVITVGILHRWRIWRICKTCLRKLIQCLTLRQFPQTFLTNPSKLRIYLCKIPTVITETLYQAIL